MNYYFLVVSRLIQELDSRALKLRGIYRVNGVKNRVELICSSFTMEKCTMDLSVASEHDMSSVLKVRFFKRYFEPYLI